MEFTKFSTSQSKPTTGTGGFAIRESVSVDAFRRGGGGGEGRDMEKKPGEAATCRGGLKIQIFAGAAKKNRGTLILQKAHPRPKAADRITHRAGSGTSRTVTVGECLWRNERFNSPP